MKVGIVAGGFKPLTSGHFAKIALSTEECDKTILLYSSAGRSKGGGLNVKSSQIEKMWKILTPELYRVFGNKIIVKDSSPWPISAVYGIIKCATRSLKHPVLSERTRARQFLENFGIKETVDHITIYGSSEDIKSRFTDHIEKGNAHKMFDDFYDQGRLSFSDGGDKLGYTLMQFYPGLTEADLESLAAVKGTYVRNRLADKESSEAIRFLPPILSDEKSSQLLDIFRGK